MEEIADRASHPTTAGCEDPTRRVPMRTHRPLVGVHRSRGGVRDHSPTTRGASKPWWGDLAKCRGVQRRAVAGRRGMPPSLRISSACARSERSRDHGPCAARSGSDSSEEASDPQGVRVSVPCKACRAEVASRFPPAIPIDRGAWTGRGWDRGRSMFASGMVPGPTDRVDSSRPIECETFPSRRSCAGVPPNPRGRRFRVDRVGFAPRPAADSKEVGRRGSRRDHRGIGRGGCADTESRWTDVRVSGSLVPCDITTGERVWRSRWHWA